MYARIDSTAPELALLCDADLVRLLKLGHDDALEHLLRRHREALYRFCCHLMTSREDAEDICQETLARAITRVDSLQVGSAFRSWLFSIARNLSIDSYRSKKRTCPMPDEETMPLPLYGETPQDRIETTEEHQTVAEALGKLAQSHQRVLMLREVDGLSYAAIAETLKVSQSAVETLLFRARRRLREEYTKTAVPVLAIVNGLRDIAARFAGPVASGPILAKMAVSTALVGGGLTTTHVAPITPRPAQHTYMHAQHSARVRMPVALPVRQVQPQTSRPVRYIPGAAAGRIKAASPVHQTVSRSSTHSRTRDHSSQAPSPSTRPVHHSKPSGKQNLSHPFAPSSAAPVTHTESPRAPAVQLPPASKQSAPASSPMLGSTTSSSTTSGSTAPSSKVPGTTASSSTVPSSAGPGKAAHSSTAPRSKTTGNSASGNRAAGKTTAPAQKAQPSHSAAPRSAAPGKAQSGSPTTVAPSSKAAPASAPAGSKPPQTHAAQKTQGTTKGQSSHGNPHAAPPAPSVAPPVVPQPAPKPSAAVAPGQAQGNQAPGKQNSKAAPPAAAPVSGKPAPLAPAAPPASSDHGKSGTSTGKGKPHGH